MGNILTKHAVQKIVIKEKGVSTLGGRKIWFDEDVQRLNADARGIFLGEFTGEDKILIITKSGFFRTTNFDLSNHFEDDVLILEKYRAKKIWSAAYYDADLNYYYLKRFNIEPSSKSIRFIGDHPDSRLIQITEVEYPRLELKFGGKNKDRDPEIIEVAEFIGVKSYKARGKRLSNYEVKVIEELEPVENEGQTFSKQAQERPQAELKPKVETPEKADEKKSGRAQEDKTKKPEDSGTGEGKTSKKKKDSNGAGDRKSGQPKRSGAGKSKAGKSGSEEAKSSAADTEKEKQRPEDVPLEVVKPGEEKKKDDRNLSNGQFSLEW